MKTNEQKKQIKPRSRMSRILRLADVKAAAVLRVPEGEKKAVKTLDTKELAKAINHHLVIIYGWQARGKLPRPELRAKGEGEKMRAVYTLKQAEAMVSVLANRYKDSPYYYNDDHATKSAMLTAFEINNQEAEKQKARAK